MVQQTTQIAKQPVKTTQPNTTPVQQTTATQPTQQPEKKKTKWWLWVLVVLLSLPVPLAMMRYKQAAFIPNLQTSINLV